MDHFGHVLKATANDYQRYILDHPLFTAITNGKITREHYVSYLRETYHLVGHTSKATALVPPRLGQKRPKLREWFEDVARTGSAAGSTARPCRTSCYATGGQRPDARHRHRRRNARARAPHAVRLPASPAA